MNNTTFLALIILSVLPASAQNVTSPDCSAKNDAAIALAQDYAARVDGMLRDVHANLQDISGKADAGRVTSEQAQELKLAATRDMIARLDTLSVVYDARLNDVRLNKNGAINNKTQAAAGNDCATGKVHPTHNGNSTVSVEELKREAAAAAVAARGEQVTR